MGNINHSACKYTDNSVPHAALDAAQLAQFSKSIVEAVRMHSGAFS